MKNIPFIAIEGPIGIGKTSLAHKLATHFDFYLLKEIVEENPFLGKFYDDIDAWSFQTEMFFLCNRVKQLEDLKRDYLTRQHPVVADYHILKNMIFAKRTLPENKLLKYEQIFTILANDLPKPNLIIYLSADIATIMKRIRQRDRTIEQNIQVDYIQQLTSDYEAYFTQFEQDHPDIPVIRIDGGATDFVKHQADLDAILQTVTTHLDVKEMDQ